MIPAEPYKVKGEACLEFIDRKIGFGSHIRNRLLHSDTPSGEMGFGGGEFIIEGRDVFSTGTGVESTINVSTDLLGWDHDNTKRKVGLVLDRYDDGGIKFAILSHDTFILNSSYKTFTIMGGKQHYVEENPLSIVLKVDPDHPFPNLPDVMIENVADDRVTYNIVGFYDEESNIFQPTFYNFDELLNLVPIEHSDDIGYFPGYTFMFNGGDAGRGSYQLTTNKNTTMTGGIGYELDSPATVASFMLNDPRYFFAGNVYTFATDEFGIDFIANCPGRFLSAEALTQYRIDNGVQIGTTNFCTLPFNLILTESEADAINYVENGIIPHDAFMYPLDWENFPGYTPSDDDNNDGDDDNTPNDNSRDITPNLPVAPTFTPSMLSNYNWYWLTAPQLQAFINWFWNDVGSITDFSDLVEKIEGLYNDLASAVLMVRYYPVDNDATWIGGKESTTSIKLGMIEQSANVEQLKTTVVPSVREIGNIHIPDKYNSFVDLSPYSALSLYLPFHGFVDMDMNLFSGHDLYVKGVYDHLTGTLQYMIYLDNQFLVNSFVVKMAVDIPITLQSKNDRDSAIFNNLTSSVGGLLGAGATLATGNPIGLVVGAQSMNSGVNSAPLNVRGTVGETGAFYAPPQCAIILRRPTIAKPSEDIWKRNIGQICGQSYTLSNLRGKGYTKVYNPRITFTSNPLQSEIDEIYDFLTEGVIL